MIGRDFASRKPAGMLDNLVLEAMFCMVTIIITRSTQRAQTSLTEADHYSHILPTVKMLSLGYDRLPP